MMTAKGRAAYFHGPGQPLEIALFPTPTPVGREALIQITHCTLCASDLHTHAGRRAAPTPVVLGHEIIGRVAALGPDADSSLAVGERVTWSVTASCGACFFCGDLLPQKCERLVKYGHDAATQQRPFTGGLADYILLAPGTSVLRLPDHLPDLVAAPANCATATAAALLRCAGPVANRCVAILGAGYLGLTACAMARSAGARHVLICDPDDARSRRAINFGATHAVDPESLPSVVTTSTDKRGADVVLECAGVADSVRAALALARVGGVVILAGTVRPTPPIALDPERVVRGLLTLRGVHNYAPPDLAAAVEFLAGPGRAFPFASLVGPSFPLDQADAAFAEAHARPGTRVVVEP